MTAKPSYEELERRIQELEKIESELEFSRKMLRVYEKASLGYQSLDENGHYITVNQNWQDTLGYTKEEVIGKSFADFIHPDWRYHFKENFPRFKSIGEILGAEFEMVKKNGDLILVSLTGKISRDQKGNFQQTHCIFHDITERKQAEKVIAEKEIFLTSLLNAIPIPVFYKDREGIYQGFNEAYEAFMGKNRDQLIGKSVFDISPKELAPIYYAKDKELLDSGGIQHYESKVKIDTDKMRDVIFDKSVYTDNKGKVIGLIGTVLDITERKRMEKALKQSEKRFRDMADLLPGAIVETDADLTVTYVNRQGLKLFGYSETDVAAGLNGLDLIHPDDRVKALKRVTDQLAKKTITATEYRVMKKDNESCWVFFNASPIYKTDQIIGFRMVLTDITERKQIEKEREKLIDELQSAFAEIKTLKGIVPICSNCKKIRDDAGYWNNLESYIQKHSDASFSHGICPECSDELYGKEDWYIDMNQNNEEKDE